MATSVKGIRGMTPELAAALKARNIDNTDELLTAARSGAQRRELARELGLKENDIMELVQRADLARLGGVGDSIAHLLEEAGVDSTQELARRRADSLYARLTQLNEEKKLSHARFTQDDVQHWIDEAKTLPDLIDR